MKEFFDGFICIPYYIINFDKIPPYFWYAFGQTLFIVIIALIITLILALILIRYLNGRG